MPKMFWRSFISSASLRLRGEILSIALSFREDVILRDDHYSRICDGQVVGEVLLAVVPDSHVGGDVNILVDDRSLDFRKLIDCDIGEQN